MEDLRDYQLFFEFIDTYLPVGFEGIPNDDPLMLKLNSKVKENNQYFYIADMLQLKILYTSPSIKQSLGIEPDQFNPGFQMKGTHPDDMERHGLSRARMIKLCNDLYCDNCSKSATMSTNLRFQHIDGHYINFLVQGYVFTATKPIATTYTLFIQTDISWFGQIKHGYNYYIGEDMSYFRLPDEELILTGCIFTDREFEVIKLIRDGMDSHNIGEKLFISPHTVDTHRRNIIHKTGFHNTSELIIDLQEKGFF